MSVRMLGFRRRGTETPRFSLIPSGGGPWQARLCQKTSVTLLSHYITVSSPSGGVGGRWSTSFSAFRTRRASGQPPAIPRRSGWPSRRKVTSRTVDNACIQSLHHGFLPLGGRRWSLIDELQGLQAQPCVGTAPGHPPALRLTLEAEHH